MATDPIFAATPIAWAGLVPATADTSLTAPTNVTTLGSAGAAGTMIYQIRCSQVASNTLATNVNIFAFDGTTYRFIDYFNWSVVTTLSATVQVAPSDKFFTNLVLPSGWSLRATTTQTGAFFGLIAWGASY